MTKIVTYNNLLNPLQRKTQEIEASTSKELLATMDINRNEYEVVVARNQDIITEDFDIVEGDIISVSIIPLGGGGGKDIIKTVAMIALVVAAPGAGVALANAIGATTALSFAGATALMAIGTVAAYVAGSMLINAILPTQTPSLGMDALDNLKSSPTYSWNVVGNTIEQGKPVPILYGRHRVTPPLISRYVETKNNLQYLNLLYAVADGETTIEPSTIKINGETIANFKDVEIYTRPGTNDQSIIGIFDDVISDNQVNKKLTTDWVYFDTIGNSVSGIVVGLVAPRGIWYVSDDGKIQNYSVKIAIEYYYNSQWIPMTFESTEILLTDDILRYWIKETSVRYVSFSSLDQAENYLYSMSGSYVSTSSTLPANSRVINTANQIYAEYDTYENMIVNNFDTITSNKQSTLRKTYKADGLPAGNYQTRVKFHEAPATGSRYGSDVTYEYLQEILTDDFTYPNTALLGLRILATDQLGGSMPRVTVIAENEINNPSTACKNVIEKYGYTLSADELTKFDDWEQHCTDKNYTCNIYFDSIYTVRKALDVIGLLGRGNAIQLGSKWTTIIDRADETPVQGFLFTMGNIEKNSFTEQFLPLQDRSNQIDITYYDETVDYEPQILQVSNTKAANSNTIKKSSINYVGCTNREMALAYAKFLLNCGRLLTITQSFAIPTEAINCRIGDVVKVAHDIPGIGLGSGRIVSATVFGMVLDREILLEAEKRYYVQLRYDDTDEIIQAEVINSETETDIFFFVDTLLKSPEKYNVYSFGEANKISKKMRVVNISTSQNQKAKITAIEYVADVYNDIEQIEPHTETDFGLKGLELNEAISYVDTSVISDIVATWRGVSLWYDVYIDNIFYQRVYTDSINIANIEAPRTYIITIRDSLGDEVNAEIALLGRFAPPEPPTNFTVIQNNDILRSSWTKSISLDTAKYEIRSGLSWETSFKIGTVGNVSTFEWFPDFNHSYNFWIKSLDSSDVYSLDAVQKLFTVSDINEALNIIYTYDGLDTATPPCGDTVGLIFVVGTGYVPIYTAAYDDIPDVTYDDIPDIAYDDLPSFEGCAIDTNQIGVTKIRMLLDYTATSGDLTYDNIPDRTYDDFPYDTYLAMTVLNNVKLSYAYSDDDTTYSDWIEYTGIVDETFRYMRFKYEFIDEVNGSIAISDFKGYLDVPDIEFEMKDEVVNTSASIVFADEGYSFYEPPHISVTTKTNTYGKITNVTNLGFDINSYDPTDGSALSGTYDLNIKGY